MGPGQQRGTSRGQRTELYLAYHAVPVGKAERCKVRMQVVVSLYVRCEVKECLAGVVV
jgi:hypothetical protein